MKNLIIIMTVGLILLTGCSKDNTLETTVEQTSDVIYVLDQNKDQNDLTTIKLDDFSNEANFAPLNNISALTNGLYVPELRDQMILSWSGISDSMGPQGTAELEIRKPTYTIHIIMETECVVVNGNKAIYGGTITNVLELSGNIPPLSKNWRFYFQVIDNNISRSRNNKISNTWLFTNPWSQSLCSIFLPNHRIWSLNGHSNVMNPGFVEVSNRRK